MEPDEDQEVEVAVRTFRDGTLALVFSVGGQDGERGGFWLGMDRDAALDLHERLGRALGCGPAPMVN